MDFEQATEQRDRLEQNHKSLCKALQAISEKHSNGLTKESCKTTQWRELKNQKEIAFLNLQNFNKVYVKTFKKEIRANRKFK